MLKLDKPHLEHYFAYDPMMGDESDAEEFDSRVFVNTTITGHEDVAVLYCKVYDEKWGRDNHDTREIRVRRVDEKEWKRFDVYMRPSVEYRAKPL